MIENATTAMRAVIHKHSIEAITKRMVVREMRDASEQNGNADVVATIETIKKTNRC